MPRLFVRDFSKSTNKSELEALFCKLCPVDDVYIPEPTVTGINRNFAIVTLNCTDDVVEKCIKAFHNSNWNGSRIRVELANVWYKNKFENERLVEATQIVKPLVVDDSQPAIIHKSIVTLKRSYLLPLIKVSLKPRKTSDVQPKRKSVAACGVRTILDDSCVTSNDELSSESESEDEEIVVPEVKSPSVVVKAASTSVTPAVVVPVASTASHLQGGGSRKGFGTLLNSTVKLNAEKTPVLKSVKKAATIDTKVERFDEYSNGGLDDDSGMSDGEYDDDSDQDGERCVAPAELEETSLLRERQRAIALMQSVLGGGLPTEAGGEAENRVSSGENGATPAIPAVVVHHEAVDAINTSAGGSGSMVSRNGWNSVVMVRFNPGKAGEPKKSEEPVAVQTALNISDHVVKNATQPVTEESMFVSSSDSGSKAVDNVQLDKLKSIFYKEGGVWWDDSGSVATGEAVLRGKVDPLFLEAEKFGIDIRAATESKDDSAASSMLFGFFESEEQVADKQQTESEEKDSAESSSRTGYVQRHEEVTSEDRHQSGTKREISSMSLDEMVQTAKKFCRIKSVDEVTKEWNESRDKLVLDYKRKFKDARKRNNGVVIAETVPTLTVRNNIKKVSAHAKSKSRGGVKHSRKK